MDNAQAQWTMQRSSRPHDLCRCGHKSRAHLNTHIAGVRRDNCLVRHCRCQAFVLRRSTPETGKDGASKSTGMANAHRSRGGVLISEFIPRGSL